MKPRQPEPGGLPDDGGRNQVQHFLVCATLGSTVLLQRLAIPLGHGQVPLVLPVVLALTLWGADHGVLAVRRLHLQIYLVAVLGCVAAAVVTSWTGAAWSPLSIIYLVVTYLPFCLCLRSPDRQAYEAVLMFFIRLMAVAAVLGVVQVGLQLVGWSYRDPFEILPSAVVLQGFTTSYALDYGSSIFKPNGFVFLEASFYSQFLALAIVAHLYLRRRGPTLYLSVAGLVATVSGTGIILVAIGTLAVFVERGKRLAGGVALLLALTAVVAISPLGDIYRARAARTASTDTSAKGRFIVPYQLTVDDLTGDGRAMLTGHGPGSAQRLAQQYEDRTAVTVVFPVIPKLAYEYGLLALLPFVVFVCCVTVVRKPSLAVCSTLLIMYLTLSGSLLQPATVYLVWALASLFTVAPGMGAVPAPGTSDGGTA